jgi:hypothetical protein
LSKEATFMETKNCLHQTIWSAEFLFWYKKTVIPKKKVFTARNLKDCLPNLPLTQEQEGSRYVFLMASTRGRSWFWVGILSMGPMHWIRGWGLAYGIYPWVSTLVMGDLMGRHFWVGCWFFSWWGGGGEEELQDTTSEAFSQDDTSWKFRFSVRQTIANGDPDPRCPGQTRAMFRLRQPVDLVHSLKTVKGMLLLVHHGTHGAVGMMVIHMWSMLLCVICLLYV